MLAKSCAFLPKKRPEMQFKTQKKNENSRTRTDCGRNDVNLKITKFTKCLHHLKFSDLELAFLGHSRCMRSIRGNNEMERNLWWGLCAGIIKTAEQRVCCCGRSIRSFSFRLGSLHAFVVYLLLTSHKMCVFIMNVRAYSSNAAAAVWFCFECVVCAMCVYICNLKFFQFFST